MPTSKQFKKSLIHDFQQLLLSHQKGRIIVLHDCNSFNSRGETVCVVAAVAAMYTLSYGTNYVYICIGPEASVLYYYCQKNYQTKSIKELRQRY